MNIDMEVTGITARKFSEKGKVIITMATATGTAQAHVPMHLFDEAMKRFVERHQGELVAQKTQDLVESYLKAVDTEHAVIHSHGKTFVNKVKDALHYEGPATPGQ